MTWPSLNAQDRHLRDWRDNLDRRISRCTGCDELIWDEHCPRCDANPKRGEAA